MKFVCLGYCDQTQFETLPESELIPKMDACFAYDDLLRAQGRFLGGEALQNARNAVTLRWDKGKPLVTDGPYAESKEQIGGILLLEADNMQHAIALMSQHPGIQMGPFEIRPADDLSGFIRASDQRRGVSRSRVHASFTDPAATRTPKITNFLWFDSQAEEAATFYVSLFPNAKILATVRYPESAAAMSGRPPGSVMTVRFELEGAVFTALNGGPLYTFSPASSFVISCDDQPEIDRLWDRLSEGGQPQPCGWIADRFGVTWQIVPALLGTLLSDPDPAVAQRVTQRFLQMTKFEIQPLLDAAAG